MEKEKVLEDIRLLVSDIEDCIGAFTKACINKSEVDMDNAQYRMSSLLVRANQELHFLHNYIKEIEK